jgi:hypothetical protein
MRTYLRKRAAVVFAGAAVVVMVGASAAFAAPVLQPGQTSAPGMSGTCTDCHTYAKPAAAKPKAKPVLFSRPSLKKPTFKLNANFKAVGYFAPSLASTNTATVTVGVERRNAKGAWVRTTSYDETATLSATGWYKNKITYVATMNINRAGKYRLRARLAYVDADSVSRVKWTGTRVVTIRK